MNPHQTGSLEDLNPPLMPFGDDFPYDLSAEDIALSNHQNPCNPSDVSRHESEMDAPSYIISVISNQTSTFSSLAPSLFTVGTTLSGDSNTEEFREQDTFSDSKELQLDSLPPHSEALAGIRGAGVPDKAFPPQLPPDLTSIVPDEYVEESVPLNSTNARWDSSEEIPGPDQASVASHGAEITLDVHVRDFIRSMLLALNPDHQGLSQIRQGLSDACSDVDQLLNAIQTIIMSPHLPQSPSPSLSPPSPSPTVAQSYLCCLCGRSQGNRYVLKRHLNSMHYPQWRYFCHFGDCDRDTHRLDKIKHHYRMIHRVDAPEHINKDLNPCPPVCTLCSQSTPDWPSFYNALIEHCVARPGSPKAGSRRPNGHDHGHGNKRRRDGPGGDRSGQGAGTRKPTSSKQGVRRSGNDTGQSQRRAIPGASRNQMHNGDSKPSLRQPSASDNCDRRTLAAQDRHVNAEHPITSILQPSEPDSNQQRRVSQESRHPRLDPRTSQGQDAPQPSVRQCRYCNHILDLNSCTNCRRSDTSTPWCHNCAPMQRDQAMQGIKFQNGALRRSYASGQDMRMTGAQLNSQISFGARMGSMMAPPNRNLSGQIAQRPQQPNQLSTQQVHAQSAHSNTQQNLFGSSGSYTVHAVHDVLVQRMSELEIESSIFESKSKLDPKSRGSSVWSVLLPFRGSPPTRKPVMGTTTIPTDGKEPVAQQFIGPPILTNVNPSFACQCKCRTRSQGSFFARSRVDTAPGRRIEVDFKMEPEARGTSHLLRTRVQVVVKMLRLRSSVARSANGKHKTEAHAAIKDALEATLEGTETKATTSHDQVKEANLDNLEYDSDVESVTDTTFSANSRASSCTDLTQFSPPSSPPPWDDSKSSFCTDLELPPSANSGSPFYLDWDVNTICSEEQPDHDIELFEEEEKELELSFDLDLHSSLNRLARCTNVPAEDLCSDQTPDLLVWDSDRVAEYLTNYLLFVMFSLARSRDNNLNPCYEKPPS